MPRECIPQDELLWLYAKPQERAPYNRCRRFGKPVWTFLRFAGASRVNVGEEIVGFQTDFLASSEQQPLRSHGDSAKVTAAITNRLADHRDFCLSEPLLKISVQLFPPDTGRASANIVFAIRLPPWIKHGAGWRFF